MANNAKIVDVSTIIAAGFDPKTGLPIKAKGAGNYPLKESMKKALRIRDEQEAINRYRWYDLPYDISSQELERLVYYKGELASFCIVSNDKIQFYLMPYALDGTIDFYGRFNTIHPIPFAEGTEDAKRQRELLSTMKLKCVYDIPLEELTYDEIINSCVLLHDYSKQLAQTIIPRQQLQDPVIEFMAELPPLARTALISGSGVTGLRVDSNDESQAVNEANDQFYGAAQQGKPYIPIVGHLEFQALTDKSALPVAEFLELWQSLDNTRRAFYGLENGGVFQKKSHMLQAEQAMNSGTSHSPLIDGLLIRQRFCDIHNALFGTVMSCEISEAAAGMDMNGDMLLTDEIDQTGAMQGDQPEVGGMTDD